MFLPDGLTQVVQVLDEAVDSLHCEDGHRAQQEQDVKDGEGDEQRRDLRLHGPLAEDGDGQRVGRDPHHGHAEQADAPPSQSCTWSAMTLHREQVKSWPIVVVVIRGGVGHVEGACSC